MYITAAEVPLAGSSVPVVFDLAYGFGDLGLDSELTISDVEILLVPEPGSLLLIGSGLLVLARRRMHA